MTWRFQILYKRDGIVAIGQCYLLCDGSAPLPSAELAYFTSLGKEFYFARFGGVYSGTETAWLRGCYLAFTGAFTEMSAALPAIDENGVLRHSDQVAGFCALREDINEAIRPILSQFGFALSFRVNQDADGITVTAVLSHRGGHTETTSLQLPPDLCGDKNSVQAVGSSVSYGKRYAASALLNITSRGEDDDGRSGSG